jgi:membrane fusion protein, multidrug efflux system
MMTMFQSKFALTPDGPGDGVSAPALATNGAEVGNKPEPSPVATPSARKPFVRRAVLGAAVLLALFAGYHYATDYLYTGWYKIATDDAYVRADISTVSSKVGGYIKAFPVTENSVVTPGTVIAEIDDGDYQLALEAAQKKSESQQATIDRFDAQLRQADASIAQARDQLDAALADSKRAQSDFERYGLLAHDKIAPMQRLEQAVADRDRTRAATASARSSLLSATAAREVLVAQQKEAAHLLAELQVQVEKAQRDLEFTKVRAAVGGVFGNKSSQVGTLIQPGTRLGALITASSLYIEANFKETQIRDMKPGQSVSVAIDALGGKILNGTVDSFAPGSGSVFSLLPPENATGNFTKIVQRVPVRIALPANAEAIELLRPGLSVVVTVDTKTGGNGGPALASAQR